MTTNQIICCDVLEGLSKIDDNSVHLVCTSPPFNVSVKYANHNDNMPHQQYLAWMRQVWEECHRVLVKGGRICINCDVTMNLEEGPDRLPERMHPLHVDFTNQLRDIGFIYRGEICWGKQNSPGKKTAWGCYDDQTEVLTNKGFKTFSEVKKEDKLATMDLDSRELIYQHPSSIICEDYSGDMYHIKNTTIDLKITPDHNMIFEHYYKKRIEVRPMNKMNKNFRIPKKHAGNEIGEEVDLFFLPEVPYGKRTRKKIRNSFSTPFKVKMDDWLRFLGIFLTDGCLYISKSNKSHTISIYQCKDKYKDEIESLLKRLPWKFTHKPSKCEYYTCNKRLGRCLSEFKNKNGRTFPDYILSLSNRQKKIFVDWLFKGDGHTDKNGIKKYLAVASKEFVNKLLKVLTDINYHYSVSKKKKQKDRIYKGHLFRYTKRIYIVSILTSKHYSIIRRNISLKKYKGKIYCVEVPNHSLLVGRNGKYAWCGNSYNQCSNPHIRRNSEYIVMASKEDLKLEGDPMMCDLKPEEFHEWTLSEWKFQPETQTNQKGHPVSFPSELPKRCIKLFTYVGNVVLDCFNGVGTTTSTAYQFGRQYIGIDNSEEYCRIAREKIQHIKRDACRDGYEFTPAPDVLKENKKKKRNKTDMFKAEIK